MPNWRGQKSASPGFDEEENWDAGTTSSQPAHVYPSETSQSTSSSGYNFTSSSSQFADADAPFETMTFTRSHDTRDGPKFRGRGSNQQRRNDPCEVENWRDPGNQRSMPRPENRERNSFQQSRDTWNDSSSRSSNDGQERGRRNSGNQFDRDIEHNIPLAMVGLVIGRGASNIRDLQNKSNTKMFVDKHRVNDSGMVPVRILGDSSSQETAIKLIEDLIATGDNRERNAFGPQESRGGGQTSTKSVEIPSHLVGKIIGRGGSMINDLQFASGAKIQVGRDNSGTTTPVKITGSSSEIEHVEQMIDELISDVGKSQSNEKFEGSRAELPAFPPDSNPRPRASGWSGDASRPPADGRRSTGNNRLENDANVNGHYDNSTKSGLIDWEKIREGHEQYQLVKWKDFPDVRKDFYVEDGAVARLSQREVEQFRLENNKIMVQFLKPDPNAVRHIPNPVRTFAEAFGRYPEIMGELEKAGFSKPSPIQMQAWPIILKGHDLIGIAQTGTGKTLAFLLPAFIHIEGQPAPRDQRGGANVLVLTPTRELALQIEEEVKKYKYKDIKCVCVYGGGNRKEQISIVTSGVEIIIATPGRLIDLITNNIVDVRSVTYLILDEADRMLDLGFQPDIRKILLDIRPERQTIMTSATWPEGVRYMATNYMNDPVQVYVGSMDLTACHSVTQRVLMVDEDEKFETLVDILKNEVGDHGKAIVFMSRKATVDFVSTQFIMKDIMCQSIHGNREQSDREQALDDLKSGAVNTLLATDVASRGIDIKDVTHVINYDFPHNIEEYVHRVGRTGRAGRTGQSITFMARHDWKYAKELITIMEEANQEVPQSLYDMATRFAANLERRRREGGNDRGGFRRGNDDDFGGFGGSGGGRNRRGGKDSFGFSVGYM